MPVTRFAGPSPASLVAPDYDRCTDSIRALGFPDDHPITIVGTAVVRRARTQSSAYGFGLDLAKILAWFLERNIDPFKATRSDAQLWWNSQVGFAPNTRNVRLVILRRFYTEARERGLRSDDPSSIIRAERSVVVTETPALTKEEAKRLIAHIDSERADAIRGLTAYRDAVIVGFLLQLCMRAAEVHSLRWNSIGMSNGRTVVAFMGKGRKPAKLDVPESLQRRLAAWREAIEAALGAPLEETDPICLSTNNVQLQRMRSRRRGAPLRPFSRSFLWQVISDRLAQVGLNGQRMGPHALRATGATLAYEGGADLVACQALLRHNSIDTTRRFYIKRLDDTGAAAIASMGLEDDESDAEREPESNAEKIAVAAS